MNIFIEIYLFIYYKMNYQNTVLNSSIRVIPNIQDMTPTFLDNYAKNNISDDIKHDIKIYPTDMLKDSLYISDDDEVSLENHVNDDYDNSDIEKDSDSKNNEPPKKKIKTIDEQKCPGCYPIFQCNQTAHYGINGCIGYTEY